MDYELRNIHKLLNELFGEQELRNFCFFENDFRAVHEQLRETDRKSKVLQMLLDHARRKGLMRSVLAWAEQENPAKYELYQPYVVAERSASTLRPEQPTFKPTSPFHSCYISYSHNDENFARQLHDDLENAGVQCWFAPDDMKIGGKLRQAIEHSIHAHSKLLLIISKDSLKSDWVEAEAEAVFELERTHKNTFILFPIRLDDEVMDTREAWAAYIRRTRHIGDFRAWRTPDVYHKQLQRVLRDLRVE